MGTSLDIFVADPDCINCVYSDWIDNHSYLDREEDKINERTKEFR